MVPRVKLQFCIQLIKVKQSYSVTQFGWETISLSLSIGGSFKLEITCYPNSVILQYDTCNAIWWSNFALTPNGFWWWRFLIFDFIEKWKLIYNFDQNLDFGILKKKTKRQIGPFWMKMWFNLWKPTLRWKIKIFGGVENLFESSSKILGFNPHKIAKKLKIQLWVVFMALYNVSKVSKNLSASTPNCGICAPKTVFCKYNQFYDSNH